MADALIDAKAKYSNFVDGNGDFYPWFKGEEKLVKQAADQLAAADGKSIKWIFQDETSKNAVSNLLEREGLISIITELL